MFNIDIKLYLGVLGINLFEHIKTCSLIKYFSILKIIISQTYILVIIFLFFFFFVALSVSF